MSRPRASQPIIFARVPEPLLAQLDRRVRERQAERPGSHVTRADVIRELLYAGLEATTPAPQPRARKAEPR